MNGECTSRSFFLVDCPHSWVLRRGLHAHALGLGLSPLFNVACFPSSGSSSRESSIHVHTPTNFWTHLCPRELIAFSLTRMLSLRKDLCWLVLAPVFPFLHALSFRSPVVWSHSNFFLSCIFPFFGSLSVLVSLLSLVQI